jgi:uncharacterized coiled-coil protein SlyX
MSEETIVVILEEKPRGNTGAVVRYEGDSLMSVRVFPKYRIDPISQPLTPPELYEAVQMWMNRAPTNGPVWDNLDAALTEKDVEIHRLSNALASETRVCEDLREACEEHEKEIARLNEKYNEATASPHYPGGPWDWLHKANMENRELKNRIAELEKLSTMQKATIDSLGKELREAEDLRKRNSQKWRTLQKEQLTFRDPERKVVCDIMANGFTMPEIARKEPELFICPNSGIKPGCDHCDHRVPHQHKGKLCEDHLCGMPCSICKGVGCKCIPYKEPSQTPAPEETKSPIQHLQDRVLELEQHQGRDRADLMEKIRGDETIANEMIDYVRGQIKTLAERQDFTRDKVKGLEDKTSRELSQAFAEVNRVLAEHRKVGDASRDRIDILDSDLAAVMRAALKQKDQIKGLEHRLGLAQDRIAEIHPSGCVPPAKSKPKSRLKTDRVKKATK